MDRASVTETVDTGSILGRVKPKTIKTGIHSYSAGRSAIKKDSTKFPPRVVDRKQLDSKTERRRLED